MKHTIYISTAIVVGLIGVILFGHSIVNKLQLKGDGSVVIQGDHDTVHLHIDKKIDLTNISADSHTDLCVWNLPLLSDNYVERISLSKDIWNYFKIEAFTHKSPKILVLGGLAGSGKTYIAAHTIHNPEMPYKFKAWFGASTESLLKSSYFELGNKLQLYLNDNLSEDEKLREVKDWLENKMQVLLIFDNVNDLEMVYKYIPNNAHIIITSNNSGYPNRIEVSTMSEDESINLFRKFMGNRSQKHAFLDPEIAKFAQELDCFPLA
ncbi:MAG: NB-ARC domain-containing protein, partial [Alphaproteobacteria bacterium]|nr:NB-ARC domain-containing protein [Alphaproteobacteria bacterium]